MIYREEIESPAERLDVNASDVQRDYVFGWLLKAFYEDEFLSRLLVFKGGNCMRKAFYLDIRFSQDLDFSIESAADLERMKEEIK